MLTCFGACSTRTNTPRRPNCGSMFVHGLDVSKHALYSFDVECARDTQATRAFSRGYAAPQAHLRRPGRFHGGFRFLVSPSVARYGIDAAAIATPPSCPCTRVAATLRRSSRRCALAQLSRGRKRLPSGGLLPRPGRWGGLRRSVRSRRGRSLFRTVKAYSKLR